MAAIICIRENQLREVVEMPEIDLKKFKFKFMFNSENMEEFIKDLGIEVLRDAPILSGCIKLLKGSKYKINGKETGTNRDNIYKQIFEDGRQLTIVNDFYDNTHMILVFTNHYVDTSDRNPDFSLTDPEIDLVIGELSDKLRLYEGLPITTLELYKSGIYNDDNIAWCLYSSFTGFNTPDIDVHKKSMSASENKPEIYVGVIHGDVNGAITTTNRVTENGLDPGIFDGCDFVIAGHIHKRQEIKKNGVPIVYCSSIRQRDMGESINGHGFVLWDVEDAEDIEYKYVDIPNPDGGFYKFVVNDISDIENDKEELLNY